MALNPNRPADECDCNTCNCEADTSIAICNCTCCSGEDCQRTE